VSVGYYDVETAAWDTYVVGALLPPGGSAPRLYWHDPARLLDAMAMYAGAEWRAHNGGRYDAMLLISLAQRRGWRVHATMQGARVLRADVYRPGDTRPRVRLTDTYALAPVSLRRLASAAGATQKGDVDYQSITPGLDPSSPAGRRLAEYLRDDVLALRDGDTAWRDVLRAVARLEPRLTLGATAWASACARIAAESRRLGESLDDALTAAEYEDARAGYYGGRVEVFRTRVAHGRRFDRNSSYPAALTRAALPIGPRRWTRAWESREGTVWARVRVRASAAPPLPVRLPGHVVYPTGDVTGAWTCRELRYAVETGDARILRVERARVADVAEPLLAQWCHDVWRERVARPAWSGLLKLFANSLTGKLAQRPERAELRLLSDGDEPADGLPLGPSVGGMRWWTVRQVSVPPNARPEWAAYLTAEARESLHRQLRVAGDSAVYCDTDSVYVAGEVALTDVGDGLGQWKHEGAMRAWRAAAPKVYRFEDADARAKVRAKGLPGITDDGLSALMDGSPWHVERGVQTLRATVRATGAAEFARASLTRSLHPTPGWVGARVRVGRTARTRAPTMREAVARWGRP